MRGDRWFGEFVEFRSSDGGCAGGLNTRFDGVPNGPHGKAYRVDDASELDPAWFEGVESVGISSGASVPDELVSGVIEALEQRGFDDVTTIETIKENMHFVLPSELRKKPAC